MSFQSCLFYYLTPKIINVMVININGCNFDINSCKITLKNGQDFQINDDDEGLHIRNLNNILFIHPITENSIKIIAYDE